MDTTIRNLDETAYRELKAQAALLGKTLGEVMNEAIRAYLAKTVWVPKRGSLQDLSPESYGEGTESLSEDIDAIVYGASP
ncbi:MAG: hypothetical protein GY856_54765 [bacterium]|nr:hypothetical protein [bacterium]